MSLTNLSRACGSALALLLLSGCALIQKEQRFCVDRGTVALLYADMSRPIYQACAEGRMTIDECLRYAELNREIRAAILKPPRNVDLDQLLELVEGLSKVVRPPKRP
jgi:hypothetical protein